MIDLEITIVFLSALFFTLLFVGSKETLFGILTFASWLVTGFLWLFLAKEPPSYSTYAVALFFNIVAILFLLWTIVEYLYKLRLKKLGKGDEELD